MASERSPLLSTESNGHDDVYLRFSPTKKNTILVMVSGYGLIHLFVVGTFIPSIPQIAEDLNSTGPVVNIAVSVSVLAATFGGLVAAPYSTFYGRRPTYLCTLPVLVVGSAGVSAARSIPSLVFWRFFQSMGASPGWVLGAGVIGDVFRLEERGRAMGFFLAACLMGPSLAPFAGGLTTHYYSWRVMQGILGLAGLIAFITFYLLFPETSQPGTRGIDKISAANGTDSTRPIMFINPLQSLWLLRSPSMLLLSIILSASNIANFVLLTPLAYTIGIRYHITNEALVGACFLPAGLGNILGAVIVGRISDRVVIKWRERRKGVWFPEDRLRASLIPFAITLPISVLAFGLVNQFVDGNLGLGLSLVCLFVTGLGVEMSFGPCKAYLVDVMHSRSVEILAANSALRSALTAMAIAVTLPIIDAYGIVITHVLCAVLLWLSFGGLCCIIKYGAQMRAYIDIGFSTIESN